MYLIIWLIGALVPVYRMFARHVFMVGRQHSVESLCTYALDI